MKIFKPYFTVIGVLWFILAVFAAIDLAGPIVGAPPTPGLASTALPADANSGTGTAATVATSTPGGSSARPGPLYQLTRNIPVVVNNAYFYHFFFYPLPLLCTFWLFWHIRSLKKAQHQRQEEVAANSVSIILGPATDDDTAWTKSWGILADWFSLMSELPQNEPKARRKGFGLHSSFGFVSRSGDGLRLTARIPAPTTPLSNSSADHQEDGSSSKDEGETQLVGTGTKGKSKNKQGQGKGRGKKASDLARIPPGLTQEFINLVRSRYEFCEVRVQPPGVDPLDLDAIKETKFRQRRQTIGEGKVVAAHRLLQLTGPSYQGIKTSFLDDPTSLIYQKLDLSSDSNLSACGIELVLLPASEWVKEVEQQVQLHHNTELGHQATGRDALSTTGGKSRNTGKAATSRVNLAAIKAQREAIETRLEKGDQAFCVWVYVWAEGTKNAVENRLNQLTTIFNQYSVNAGPKTGSGQRFGVVRSGQGLAEVKRRAYPVFFTPEISVLTVQELAAIWHMPNRAIRGPERAGAMSPSPALALIHRTILPDGRTILSDDKWRRIIGTYTQPDGTKLEVGITEQGCLRGCDATGRPGSGKSVDLTINIIQDTQRNDTINVGKGKSSAPWNSVFALDPNGDFVYDTLDALPDSHEAITAIIDPLDTERVVGLNPMALPKSLSDEGFEAMVMSMGVGLPAQMSEVLRAEFNKDSRSGGNNSSSSSSGGGGYDNRVGLVASAMIEVFAKTQGVTMDTTPTIYRVISNAIRLAVGADSNATIWTLLRLINDEAYRAAMVSRTRDPLAQHFWTEEFDNIAKGGGEKLAPTRSRLENLLRQESIRRLLTQRVRTLDLRQSIDRGHLTLGRLPPELGVDKGFLLATCFNILKQAVFSRSNISKGERRMCSVYLDEFQDIVGADAATLQTWLEQARKFGGAVTLAHQNLSQVKVLLEALKGTVGSFIPMLVGSDDQKFYANYLGSEEWPREQIDRAFAKLPPHSKVAKLYDQGQDFTPVLLTSLPEPIRLPSDKPILVAVKDENSAYGYHIEPYNPSVHGEALEEVKGFWEPTNAVGKAKGIVPTTPTYCPHLIEELTSFLYQQDKLAWGLQPFDMRSAELAGFNIDEVSRINRAAPDELKEAQQLLLQTEQLDFVEREERLASLDERQWQLYRMSRKGRDIALRKVILDPQYKGLIPEKRNRILTLSRLWVGTPVSEIEAESKRPDAFTIEAEGIRARMMQEAEEAPPPSKGKGSGGGSGKKKAAAI